MSQVSAVRDRKHSTFDDPSSPFNVDYPDLVEIGDLLELIVVSPASNNNFTASGWTSLAKVDGVSGLTAEKFYRTASGGEAGSTFALSQSSSIDIVCLVRAIREDLSPGTPETASATSSGSFDPPSLSPSGGDRLYLWTVDGGHRFGNRRITLWDSTIEERIQVQETGIAANASGGERLLEAATFDPASMSMSHSSTWAAFTTAIPIDSPPAGDFPVIEAVSQGTWPTSETSQTMDLPSGVSAGDLLVATVAVDSSVTVSISGWTELATDASGTEVRGTVFQRVADGTEGASVTVTLSGTDDGSYVCRRISGADGSKTEAGTPTTGSGHPTWPSLTPAEGADDILWLADVTVDSTRDLIGFPVNYGADPVLEQVGDQSEPTGVYGGVLARNQATATPGAGEIVSSGEEWVAHTVAVYPAGPEPAETTITNVAKGRANEYARRVAAGDPANCAFVMVLLQTTVGTLDSLRDYDTLADLLAVETECDFTNYSRAVRWSPHISAPTVDHGADTATFTYPHFTFSASQGVSDNDIGAAVLCYDPDTTSGTDADLIPVWVARKDEAMSSEDGLEVPVEWTAREPQA